MVIEHSQPQRCLLQELARDILKLKHFVQECHQGDLMPREATGNLHLLVVQNHLLPRSHPENYETSQNCDSSHADRFWPCRIEYRYSWGCGKILCIQYKLRLCCCFLQDLQGQFQ